jgi:hypothetical protein
MLHTGSSDLHHSASRSDLLVLLGALFVGGRWVSSCPLSQEDELRKKKDKKSSGRHLLFGLQRIFFFPVYQQTTVYGALISNMKFLRM